MKYFSIFTLTLLLNTNAFAGTERMKVINSSELNKYIVYSSNHSDPTIANVAKFWVSGLDGGCKGVYYFADVEKSLHSAVLIGLAKVSQTIVFRYHIDVSKMMPGTNDTCELVSFQLGAN